MTNNNDSRQIDPTKVTYYLGHGQSIPKPRLRDHFTPDEKAKLRHWKFSAILVLTAGAYFGGAFDGLNPNLPMATDAELLESHYPDRTAMMETLQNRIGIFPICNINMKDGSHISVFVRDQEPFGEIPEGAEERVVDSPRNVLPACANIIRGWGQSGIGYSVTYSLTVDRAWGGHIGPGYGLHEEADDDGDGIFYEPTYLELGNKWHDSDAADRLDEENEKVIGLIEELEERKSRLSNIWGRLKTSVKDNFCEYVGCPTVGGLIQDAIGLSHQTSQEQRVLNSVRGQNETHPV